jgi:hypothetical protein
MKTLAESVATLWCGTPPADSTAGAALGWLLIAAAGLVVVFAFVQSVRLAWRPGEDAPDHPKRSIFDRDGYES